MGKIMPLQEHKFIKKVNLGVADSSWENARVVLLGAPCDGTSSYRPGSRFAPEEIRRAMEALEEYSLALHGDLYQAQFYDAGDLNIAPGNIENALVAVENAVATIISGGKIPLTLGGEHTITIAAVRGILQHLNPAELVVLQFDAHADLRKSYLGEEISHACVMHHLLKMPIHRLYQFGIRSAAREEMAEKSIIRKIYPYQVLEPVQKVLPELTGRPIYVSIDIDVVDPGYAPGTGAPEPGGITSYELFQALYCLKGLHIVGMDLVEISPPHDPAGITALLGAKIIREALIMLGG